MVSMNLHRRVEDDLVRAFRYPLCYLLLLSAHVAVDFLALGSRPMSVFLLVFLLFKLLLLQVLHQYLIFFSERGDSRSLSRCLVHSWHLLRSNIESIILTTSGQVACFLVLGRALYFSQLAEEVLQAFLLLVCLINGLFRSSRRH